MPPSDGAELKRLVDDMQKRMVELERQLAQQQKRVRQRRALMLSLGIGAALTATVAVAASGNCPNAMPYCFSADTPAIASEINMNFAQLKEWVEQKVGATGTAAVSITGATTIGGSTTVNNQLTANSVRVVSTTSTALSVSAAILDGSTGTGGVEIRHSNGTQGIGIGYNTIYATGSWADQSLGLQGRGNGAVVVNSGDFIVNANVWSGASVDTGEVKPNSAGGLQWLMCGNGTFACGVGFGHVGNENRYWEGVRLAVRCCPL